MCFERNVFLNVSEPVNFSFFFLFNPPSPFIFVSGVFHFSLYLRLPFSYSRLSSLASRFSLNPPLSSKEAEGSLPREGTY